MALEDVGSYGRLAVRLGSLFPAKTLYFCSIKAGVAIPSKNSTPYRSSRDFPEGTLNVPEPLGLPKK